MHKALPWVGVRFILIVVIGAFSILIACAVDHCFASIKSGRVIVLGSSLAVIDYQSIPSDVT